MLLKVLNEFEPDYLAVAFDTKGPTFRHKKFPEYKAHRPEVDPELISQIGLVKQIVDAFGFKRYEQQGYEADDIIGTIISQVSAKGRKSREADLVDAIIVTGDLDMLQLVDENVKVNTPRKGLSDTVTYDMKAVEERYGIPPIKLADYKGIVGDASDNIPGIKGVGPKGARELLSRHHSLDDIYQHLEELPDKWKEKFITQRDSAILSRELAVIRSDVPIGYGMEDCSRQGVDYEKVRELFKKLRFDSLIRRLPESTIAQQGSLFS